jgi:hypothetical protein
MTCENAAVERVEVIAAFHDAAVGELFGDAHDLARRKGKVRLVQSESSERVLLVAVESGREQHELRAECAQRG